MSAISRSNPQSNPQNTTETAPHPANWPFALEESQYRELETAAVQMAKLIAKIPLEIYKNRAAALVHDFKLSLGESFTDYLMQSENAIRHARFRPDFILTHEGWQCIEVNGGNPGAWRLSCTADSYTSNPKLTDRLMRNQQSLEWENTVSHFFRHLCLSSNNTKITNLAIVIRHCEQNSEFNAELRQQFNQLWRAVVQEKSGKTSHAQVVFTNYESLTYSKTEVSYEKNGESIPIHAVIEDSVDDSPARMKAFRAFKKGLFDLHSGPISVLINNKLALAILSEKAAWLSPEERRTVEKHIPWTRHLAHGQTSDENGQEIDLPHFVRTQRKQCVLKKAVSHGGLDVIIGAYTPAESWNSLLEQAVQEGGWIVQKWLNSVAVSSIEPMIDSSTEPSKQKNDVIFGMFVVADKAIGGFSRMLPKSGYLPMRQEEQDALKQLSISATANADSEVALCPIFYTRKQPAQAASEAFHREGH